MCILLAAVDCLPGWPLLVLANRDEFHSRDSAPAQPWRDAPDCVGGRDLVAGGSWLGQRNDGRFAAVTNLRSGLSARAPRSRGALVTGVLFDAGCVPSWVDAMLGDVDAYGAFQLVVADAGSVWKIDAGSATSRRLDRGIHVLSNGAGDCAWPKVERLRSRFAHAIAAGMPTDDALLGLLGDDWQPPDDALPDTGVGIERERLLAPIFIRGEHYGTRASTLVLHHESGTLYLRERSFGAAGAVVGDVAWEYRDAEAEWELAADVERGP
ncbi:MAG: NRDE family protein [Xanthomonadales bacterium]|nr:NRDE family protein [Xanthomonadales bacterium]